MNKMESKSVSVCGDVFRVYWTGSVWQSPCNGRQHASATGAMRAELEAHYSACGDDVEDDDTQAEIDGYLSQMSD